MKFAGTPDAIRNIVLYHRLLFFAIGEMRTYDEKEEAFRSQTFFVLPEPFLYEHFPQIDGCSNHQEIAGGQYLVIHSFRVDHGYPEFFFDPFGILFRGAIAASINEYAIPGYCHRLRFFLQDMTPAGYLDVTVVSGIPDRAHHALTTRARNRRSIFRRMARDHKVISVQDRGARRAMGQGRLAILPVRFR